MTDRNYKLSQTAERDSQYEIVFECLNSPIIRIDYNYCSFTQGNTSHETFCEASWRINYGIPSISLVTFIEQAPLIRNC